MCTNSRRNFFLVFWKGPGGRNLGTLCGDGGTVHRHLTEFFRLPPKKMRSLLKDEPDKLVVKFSSIIWPVVFVFFLGRGCLALGILVGRNSIFCTSLPGVRVTIFQDGFGRNRHQILIWKQCKVAKEHLPFHKF